MIDLVLNSTNDRTTTTLACWPYDEEVDERQIGLVAVNQMNRNIKKTFPSFIRFLGLNELGTV